MDFKPPKRRPVTTHYNPQSKAQAKAQAGDAAFGGPKKLGQKTFGKPGVVAGPKHVLKSGPATAGKPAKKPPLVLQPTTLWEYPSQHYGEGQQGSQTYRGATPSYVIWNLFQRYTKPKELVIDPFCGSGTTLDVARDLDRRALGYDLNPQRPDIFRVDARKLPPEITGKVSCVFMDPPYSTHIDYSDDPRCIGKLDAGKGRVYYEAMEQVIGEAHRVLKVGGHLGLYVSDSYVHKGGKGVFHPIGFELFGLMCKKFTPVDIIAVTRHNKTLEMGNFRAAAEEGNFFLRGFNYLFIVRKD